MNQYRCETCEHRFTPDYWKDGCNRFGKTFVSDDEMRFIFTYGCASHSDFQSERDKVLDEFLHLLDIRCDYIRDIKLSSNEIYKMANGLREKVKK